MECDAGTCATTGCGTGLRDTTTGAMFIDGWLTLAAALTARCSGVSIAPSPDEA